MASSCQWPPIRTGLLAGVERVALVALTTIALIVVITGVLFATELGPPGSLAAPGAPPTTLTGWFHTLYGDAPRGGGHLHTHRLVDDNGRATELVVPDSVIAAAGGRAALNHLRVTVQGRSVSALPSAGPATAPLFEVLAIAVDGGAAGTLPGASPLGAQALVSGSQKWAV